MRMARINRYLGHPTICGLAPSHIQKIARIIRAIGWASFHVLGRKEVTCWFPNFRIHMCFLVGTGVVTELFVLRDDYEVELGLLSKILSPGMIFLDIGANFGLYSLVASQLVGNDGRVLAVEPNPVAAVYLKRNIQLNLARNVLVFEKALSDVAERKALWIHELDPFGSSSLSRSRMSSSAVEVETTTLDALCCDLPRLDLIKIDVEGWETKVLRGGVQTLRRWSPMLIFEVSPKRYKDAGADPREAFSILKMYGYKFCVWDGRSLRGVDEEELACQLSFEDRINVIGLPNPKSQG